MPPESLPEDFRDWPDDPYELFGVAAETDERGLRRAYNQLVKRYPPERFPEHFMRVRQAYEWLRRFAEYRVRFSASETDTPTEDATDRPEFTSSVVTEENPDTLAASAWQLAIDGDRPAAYRQLRELADRYPEHKTIRLQLFWLLRIDTSLDDRRIPGGWLTPLVCRSVPWSRPWWVYLQWIESSATEALSARCTELLRLPESRPHLRELLQSRWKWSMVNHRWERIRDDLAALRDQFAIEDRKLWMSILFLATDFLAWSTHSGAIEEYHTCREELTEFKEFEIEASAAFDRLADLQILADTWQATSPESPFQRANLRQRKLVELVRNCWNRTNDDVAAQVRTVIEDWIDDPSKALNELDAFAFAFPDQYLIVLHGLFAEIDRSFTTLSREERKRQIQPVICATLQAANLQDYPRFRSAILQLILRESVTVDEVVAIGLEELPDDAWTEWCQPLYNDLPLRTVTTAVAAYWS